MASASLGSMQALRQSVSSLSAQSLCPASAIRPFPCVPRAMGAPPPTRACGGLGESALASKARETLGARGSRGRSRAVVVMKSAAAASYAAALADIGKSHNVLQGLHSDIEKLGRCLEDPEFSRFLTVPVISAEKKKEVLNEVAVQGRFQPYTKSLLNVMVDKNRTELLKDLVKEFEAIYAELTDTQIASVTSAVKLDNAQASLIASKIMSLTGAKNVSLKNVIDPSLIAGFVVTFGKDSSSMVDMSVKGQLARISQQIELSEKLALV